MNPFYAVRVPATTANLGSGFDTLGMALTLYNEVYFTPDEKAEDIIVSAEGEGAGEIPSGRKNMIVHAMDHTAGILGITVPGGRMQLFNRIPLARGLGSSSAALAAGIYLANMIAGEPLSRMDMLRIAADMEGHPDNAAPAVLGGFCMAVIEEEGVMAERVQIPTDWSAVVAIPAFELMTEKARAVLPTELSRQDAVHNIGSVSFLLASFFFQNPALMRRGMEDRIHVPYRMDLIPGAKEAMDHAYEAGAYGATISGSGPTIIAFAAKGDARAVGEAMVKGFREKGIAARSEILGFDTEGVHSF